MKWYMLLMFGLITIPIVFAGTECDISGDNLTWVNITRYGGSTDDTYREVYIPLLNESQQYYFRCRNDSFPSGTWAYTEEKTEEGGINEMIIAVTLIFLFLTAIAVFALIKTDRMWLKIVFGLTTSLFVMILLRLSSWFVHIDSPEELELINTLDHFYQWGIWGFRFMLIISMFILVIIVFNIIRTANRRGKKEDDWERWGNE